MKRADPTSAERQQRFRDRRKLGGSPVDAAPVDHRDPSLASNRSVTVQPPPTDHQAPVGVPLHATTPNAVGSPEQFSEVLSLADEGASSARDEPFVPPPPAEPKPEPTAADVEMIAFAVVAYWRLGSALLLLKNPSLVALASALPPELGAAVSSGKIDGFIHAATTRVARKLGLRVPYGDEIVVAGALGLATFGLVSKSSSTSTSPAVESGLPEDAGAREPPTSTPPPPPPPPAPPVPRHSEDA